MRLETVFEKFDQFADAPDAVAKMRELVLRLAFSGRLTSKSSKYEGSHQGWENRTIESIATSITPGFACSRSHQVKDGHVHLRTHNISTLGALNFDLLVKIDPKMVDPEKTSIRQGDILFNNTNSQELVGKTSLVDRDYNYGFSNHITRIRLREGIDPSFVVFYLTLLRNSGYFAQLCTRWINQAAVNTNTLKEQTIPIPSIVEQKRIVAKVDELMALCERLEVLQKERETRHAALARAAAARFEEAPTPANLNLLFHESYSIPPADLRKTILNLAVQGKLVPQDPNDKPADTLVDQISEFRDQWLVGKRAKSAKRIREIDDSKCDHNVPTSWTWCRLGDLALDFRYGTSRKCSRDSSGVPVLRIPNIKEGRVDASDLKLTPMPESEFADLRLQRDDLLIVRSNGSENLVGRCAVVSARDERFVYAGYLVRVRLPRELIFSRYLHIALSTPGVRDQIEGPIRTTSGVKNINTTELSNLVFPLPPCAEQHRIAAKVDQLMVSVDQLEIQIATSRDKARELLDAVVHELLTPRSNTIEFPRSVDDTVLRRTAVGCYVIERMASKPSFGRTALMKVFYLSETHLDCALDLKPMRDAAGPYDPWIEKFESLGVQSNWFDIFEKNIGNGRMKVEYRSKAPLTAKAQEVTSILGDQKAELDRLLSLFSKKSTEEVEIITTLFAAWNDALIDGHSLSDDEIIREVRENWHPKKMRFSSDRLRFWLNWVRQNGLVPKGHGPRTIQQSQLALN
jgi:type I restriction enzyme S subunit